MIYLVLCYQGHRAEDGPPSVGTKVKVIWTDGTLWGATFKGTNSQVVYKVRQLETDTFL